MSKGDNFANGALVTRAGNAKKSSEELNGISESCLLYTSDAADD